jgi:ABC-type bacteriocin/lantibiotic exporter with double-glycine peptidase domain
MIRVVNARTFRTVCGGIVLCLTACLLSACHCACRSIRAQESLSRDRRVLLAFPFFPDGSDQCGPSALASVLGYWGKPESPARLKQDLYQERLKGSLTVDLLLSAEQRGMYAEMFNGDLDRIRRELDAGRPLIAFVNTGFRFYPVGHYLVITGYDDGLRCVFAHSGLKRDKKISYKKLDRQWEKTERWALLILPSRP